MSVIAVTGASGFLGRHVCQLLRQRGDRVVEIGRNEHGVLSNRESGDTEELFDGVDAIAHLAGAMAMEADTPLAAYLPANVALTDDIVRRGRSSGVRRFVFSSSRLVYRSDLGRSANETDPAAPESVYGLSKVLAEQVMQFHGRQDRVSATSLRISQLVGAGDGNRGALARFAESAFTGQPIRVAGSGAAVRDVVDVRDAARAVLCSIDALEAGHPPPVINVGGGPHTIAELAMTAAIAAGRGPEAIEHFEVEHDDRSHWSLDTTLASQALGWTVEIDLVDALRHRHEHDPTLDHSQPPTQA